MRKLVFILLLFSSLGTFAQANFSRIAFGINTGLTAAFTGLSYGLSPDIAGFDPRKTITINKDKFFGVTLDYNFTPFITGGIAYNSIFLKDGTDKYNRAFISNFSSIEIGGKVALGQFIDFSGSNFLYNIRNVNAGLGLGFISGTNNVADYVPGLPQTATTPFPRRMHANDLGKSKFSGVVSFPVSIGYFINIYNVYEEPKFVIGADYKVVLTTSDDIDGFNDNPNFFLNKNKDAFTTFGISIKYLFGPKGLYYK
ncbi:MAG: hypothetical protein IE931_00515 [Sphingobacteriales bacterium]|nr:hypothetical protein [Sphingobacteriales bacterium]